MKTFFLQTTADLNRFEEVNETLFNDANFVLNEAGTGPRYTGHYIVVDGGAVSVSFAGNANMLAAIARMAGVSAQPQHGVGVVDKPTHVRIKKGRSNILFEVETGRKYKLVA